jgi:hypothetical protein
VKLLHAVLPLELSRVDHPDGEEHEIVEVAGKGTKDVQDRMKERDPTRPRLLITEPGVGYRLRDGDA